MTKEEIMREYAVTEEDIEAALDYATKLIESECGQVKWGRD